MKTWLRLAAVAAVTMMTPPVANAALNITIIESGGDVVANLEGTLKLTGLTFQFGGTFGPAVIGGSAFAGFGGGGDIFFNSGFSGPGSWGPGNLISPSSSTGDNFVFRGSLFGAPAVGLPGGFASGSALKASMRFSGRTIAGMGLNPGTYIYLSGVDPNEPEDKITVKISRAVSAVPEPASWAMMIAGFGLMGAALRRRIRFAGLPA